MKLRNTLTEYSRLLIASLVQCGIEEAIISPGSRSTPLVWAAIKQPALKCRYIIDERSAAFFALGKTKVTGKPVALICTSGTAGANYYPAILEASQSCTPMLVITADRPLELQNCDAAQTVNQYHFFGKHVRFFSALNPDANFESLLSLKRTVVQAVSKACFADPGPVHLNFHAAKPLEPVYSNLNADEEILKNNTKKIISTPLPLVKTDIIASPSSLTLAVQIMREAKKGVITFGPISPARQISSQTISRLVQKTGFLVYAETSSQARFRESFPNQINCAEAVVPLWKKELEPPDLIIHVGAPLVSMAWNKFLANNPHTLRIVFSDGQWGDPFNSANLLLHGNIEKNIENFLNHYSESRLLKNNEWNKKIIKIDSQASTFSKVLLEKQDKLTSAGALKAIVNSLQPDQLLALGNSLAIREIDIYVPPENKNIKVWSQRGVNGIDGIISGAAGAMDSTAQSGVLVTGDISFLHDLSGLAAAKLSAQAWTIIILNNFGGKIFDMLPISQVCQADDLDFWTTPHKYTFKHAAKQFGYSYLQVRTENQLILSLKESFNFSRSSILEVIIEESKNKPMLYEIQKACRGN